MEQKEESASIDIKQRDKKVYKQKRTKRIKDLRYNCA